MLVLAMGCYGGADGVLVVAVGTDWYADMNSAGMAWCLPVSGSASAVPGTLGALDSILGCPVDLAVAAAGIHVCNAVPGQGLWVGVGHAGIPPQTVYFG